MIHWLSNAINTYILHSEHGSGYQWWSGPGADLGMFAAVIVFVLRHNCHEHRCFRIGRVLGEDGRHRCKKHHKRVETTKG